MSGCTQRGTDESYGVLFCQKHADISNSVRPGVVEMREGMPPQNLSTISQSTPVDTMAKNVIGIDTSNDVRFHTQEVPERKPSNPKDAAATNRLDLSLFPGSARAYGALALTEGDLKYGGYNWRTVGIKASVYLAACGRHLEKWNNGEDCDPHTHVPHLANALACIAVLIDASQQGNLNDDRPPAQEAMPHLFKQCEEIVSHLQRLFPDPPVRHTQTGGITPHTTLSHPL